MNGSDLAERLPPERPRRPARPGWVRIVGILLTFGALVTVAAGTMVPLNPNAPGIQTEIHTYFVLQALAAGLAITGLPLAVAPRAVVRRPALAAALVSTSVTAVMLAYHARWGHFEGDAALFFRMAEEWPWRPGGWFRYRLVAPWLARFLGGREPAHVFLGPVHPGVGLGYWRLALFSVAATGPALSLLLRDLHFGTAARHLGVLLYLGSFAVLYNTWNYAMPDPLAMLLLVLACRAIVRGRDVELAVWLLLGGLTKEVVLFLVPVRWLWARRAGLDLPQALRAGLVALPALAVFAWLRFRPDEAAEYTGFVTGNAFLFPWRNQPDNVARLYSPFAAGWALVALSLRRPDRWTIAAAGFAVPCVLSLLVTDAGRMLVYLTPFAIPAMLRATGAGERVSRRGLVALLLVGLSMRLWEPFAPLWKVPVVVRRPLALLLAAVCAWLAYRAADSSTDASSPASEAYE